MAPSFEVTNWGELLWFAAYCIAVGAVVFVVDWVVYKLKGTDSLLGIVYTGKNAFALLAMWSFGAGFMGLIGGYAEIIQLNRQAVIVLGVAWPVVLSKWVAAVSSKSAEKEPDAQEDESTSKDED
jgi:hypothetical protein